MPDDGGARADTDRLPRRDRALLAAEEFMVVVAEGRHTDTADITGELVKFSR